jgi:hypothetical protein
MPTPLDSPLFDCSVLAVLHRRCAKQSREFSRGALFCTLLLLALLCTSCGAVGSGPAAPAPAAVTITVSPSSTQTYQGAQVQFSAKVQNATNTAVMWQVNQVPNGNSAWGSIDASGLYKAPAVVPGTPTVTITAALQSDTTKTGSSSLTILSLSAFTGQLLVSPSLSSVTTSQLLQFQILMPGILNSDVNWAATGGSISPAGIFTPPSTAGAYQILASLIANPGATGSATVEVTTFQGMLTWRNDNSRSGINNQELALAPATVNSSSFGKLFSCPTDGYAYAQPLYVPNLRIGGVAHNVIFVATEKDSVFAFDADANPCVTLWQTNLAPDGTRAVEFPNLSVAGTNIVPFVGITGTPAIDRNRSVLYVVAANETITLNPARSHLLYAIDLSTGSNLQRAGVGIVPPDPLFNSAVENQRPALLLDNGAVYVGFGSYGGQCAGQTIPCPYRGLLYEYDASSLHQIGVFDVVPNALQGGIWESGGGPAADSNHNVYVTTSDGPFDVTRGGHSYSDSVLRLGTSGGLPVSDYFSPCDPQTMTNTGSDVGTAAPVVLPDSVGSLGHPHLLLGGSNGGALYILDRDNMGGCVNSPTSVQTISVGEGAILSTPLFWNNSVFVAAGGGHLKSFPMSGGMLQSSPSSIQSPKPLGPQGATPVLSSNGTNNAILWLIDSSGALATPNTPAILHAFDPNNLSNEIYHGTADVGARDTAGPAVKFTVPTVANGKVYVGTQTELDVYGLLP